MPPSPSDPASMPTPRNSRAMGTPNRCDARLNSTLIASSRPQVRRRRAVAWGSSIPIGEVTGSSRQSPVASSYGTALRRARGDDRKRSWGPNNWRLATGDCPLHLASMFTESLVHGLALIGIVIMLASLLSGVIDRSGLPQVAIFLLLGVLVGPTGLGIVNLRLDSPPLQVIATLALVLVLFSDAIAVDIGDVKRHRGIAT